MMCRAVPLQVGPDCIPVFGSGQGLVVVGLGCIPKNQVGLTSQKFKLG